MALRLRRGTADLAAVQREITRLAHGKVAQAYPLATQAENTEHSIHLQAVALWLLGGVLGVISLLVIGQLLVRLNFLEASDHDTLRALGVSRGALLAVGLGRAAAIGAAGAAAGTLLAVAVSPLLPVGLAGVAEPHRGMHADGAVLGLGAAAAVLATVACAAWPAWRAASAARVRARRAVATRTRGPQLATLATSGIGWVSAVIGVRLALQPGAGRTALPVRSTIASAMVGVAALTAAIVFSASLGHLLATPSLYGVTWSAYVSNSQSAGIGQAAGSLRRDSSVTAWSAGYSAVPISISGVRADGIAMLPGHGGSLLPVPVQGHLPTGADQIALGEHTLAAIHAALAPSSRCR